jgi:hypothetical protein
MTLRQVCENRSKAVAQLGQGAADALAARLADIEAVDSLTELSWAPVELQPDGTATIGFFQGCSLVAVANHNNNPLDEGDVVKWEAVERIKIMDINRS